MFFKEEMWSDILIFILTDNLSQILFFNHCTFSREINVQNEIGRLIEGLRENVFPFSQQPSVIIEIILYRLLPSDQIHI